MLLQQVIALFFTMLILAIVPGPAVFAVVSQSFSNGFNHGTAITFGVLLGDFIYILLALFGLSAIANAMGPTFELIKYASALYLCWLGISMLRNTAKGVQLATTPKVSQLKNIITGTAIALGNPKALIFYVSFFPAFVPMNQVDVTDVIIILATATLAFGSVNLTYAYLASSAKHVFTSPNAVTIINRTAGSIMLIAGILIVLNI
ncbi:MULTISPECIES: LysE family translocator [Shewanella]|uniref:LysE family translocator n=1 Tax=Shewanella TaxID=22 RepID=UPI000C5D617D|nr:MULTISPECIES: LysE family translocator [Shewanella]NCQ46620.1 LysE family translocator [Shewanella frigidimarina]NCO72605.1 LysE family translocator [Shewanella vesiculosa]NCP38155.1 LysE family translocator [Shewanella vesiculosa]NCP70461.1 LysE family translocator [Shewanella vesiculosa]NCP75888.1 LysE family translocator [Shewanella vesiculosa]